MISVHNFLRWQTLSMEVKLWFWRSLFFLHQIFLLAKPKLQLRKFFFRQHGSRKGEWTDPVINLGCHCPYLHSNSLALRGQREARGMAWIFSHVYTRKGFVFSHEHKPLKLHNFKFWSSYRGAISLFLSAFTSSTFLLPLPSLPSLSPFP